jgi:hypothetical protein
VFLLHKNASLAFSPVGCKRKNIEMSGVNSENRRKGGRPKQAIKRESATGVRFTKAEYFIVKSKAAKSNHKLTEYIRVMAIEGAVICRFSPEEKEIMRKLAGMANNLNQIARIANKERLLTAVLEIEKIRVDFDRLLERFRR